MHLPINLKYSRNGYLYPYPSHTLGYGLGSENPLMYIVDQESRKQTQMF